MTESQSFVIQLRPPVGLSRINVSATALTSIAAVKESMRQLKPCFPSAQHIILTHALGGGLMRLLEDRYTLAHYGIESATTIFYKIVRNGALPQATPQKKILWLLIRGCSKSPDGVSVSKRIGYDGDDACGMQQDFANMQKYIRSKSDEYQLHNMISNMISLKKEQVLDAIAETCEHFNANRNDFGSIAIYYTGNGEKDTGNWCFSDGVVSLKDVLNVYKRETGSKKGLSLKIDCCYSGNWALELRRYKEWQATINAASWPGKIAYDNGANGGYFTCAISNGGAPDEGSKLKWCAARMMEKKYTIMYFIARTLVQ